MRYDEIIYEKLKVLDYRVKEPALSFVEDNHFPEELTILVYNPRSLTFGVSDYEIQKSLEQ